MTSETTRMRFRKRKLGTYPYISVVLSTTLALFVIGVFGLLLIYSKELERVVRENVKIQVYLKNRLTNPQRQQIEKNLSARTFLPKDTSTPAIQFISRDEAARTFIKETGEDFKKFLGENPLRDAFLVRIDPLYQDTTSMARIKKEVEQISGVFQVYYVPNLIGSINENVTNIALILLGLAGILLMVVVLLINNTLRLALFSQRFLIRSMQLVGARRWFIQKPFLVRASFHGLIAGVLACGLLLGTLSFATHKIDALQSVQNNDRIIILMIGVLITGMIVAVLSTFRAVSKYLKLSLDELY